MTDDQLKQMEQKLEEIMEATAALAEMIHHLKEPDKTPSPFSGGGPADR